MTAWKLAGVAPHLSQKRRVVLEQHIAAREVGGDAFGWDAATVELLTELRFKLAES